MERSRSLFDIRSPGFSLGLGCQRGNDMSDLTPFNTYFKELHAVAHQGDAREESFYPALAAMLKAVAKELDAKTLASPRSQGLLTPATRTSACGTAETESSAMSRQRGPTWSWTPSKLQSSSPATA